MTTKEESDTETISTDIASLGGEAVGCLVYQTTTKRSVNLKYHESNKRQQSAKCTKGDRAKRRRRTKNMRDSAYINKVKALSLTVLCSSDDVKR